MDRILSQMSPAVSRRKRKTPSRLVPDLDDDLFEDDPQEAAEDARIFKEVQEMANRAIEAGLSNKSKRH